MNNQSDKIKIKKLCGVIGLARRAGAIIVGTESVVESVRKKKAVCVYVSNNVSENTAKKLFDKAAFYDIPIKRLPLEMTELSQCIGYRPPAAAVSLTNGSFLKLINDYLEETEKNEN